MFTRERTPQHAWFMTKRDELVQKIEQSNDPNMKFVLESLRDLFSYLPDGNFSENLKVQFEQIEAKLTLYPTLEDMVVGHNKILQIINDIKKELELNVNVKVTSIFETLTLMENRIMSIESQSRLIRSGQNEIIVKHEREHKSINSKLDELLLTCHSLPDELKQQALAIQDAHNKIDIMDKKITQAEDNIKSVRKLAEFPQFWIYLVCVGVVSFGLAELIQ